MSGARKSTGGKAPRKMARRRSNYTGYTSPTVIAAFNALDYGDPDASYYYLRLHRRAP